VSYYLILLGGRSEYHSHFSYAEMLRFSEFTYSDTIIVYPISSDHRASQGSVSLSNDISRNRDLRHPSIEDMVQMLIRASSAQRWNHFRKDYKTHCTDWVDAGDSKKILSRREYLELPWILAEHPDVQLCRYLDGGQPVWGFYRERLLYLDSNLSHVGVVYDPYEDEIIHCMRIRHRHRYFERKQNFVEIRW
jgi:hypothetical protein